MFTIKILFTWKKSDWWILCLGIYFHNAFTSNALLDTCSTLAIWDRKKKIIVNELKHIKMIKENKITTKVIKSWFWIYFRFLFWIKSHVTKPQGFQIINSLSQFKLISKFIHSYHNLQSKLMAITTVTSCAIFKLPFFQISHSSLKWTINYFSWISS